MRYLVKRGWYYAFPLHEKTCDDWGINKIIENEDGVFQIVSNKTIKTKEFKEI